MMLIVWGAKRFIADQNEKNNDLHWVILILVTATHNSRGWIEKSLAYKMLLDPSKFY